MSGPGFLLSGVVSLPSMVGPAQLQPAHDVMQDIGILYFWKHNTLQVYHCTKCIGCQAFKKVRAPSPPPQAAHTKMPECTPAVFQHSLP